MARARRLDDRSPGARTRVPASRPGSARASRAIADSPGVPSRSRAARSRSPSSPCAASRSTTRDTPPARVWCEEATQRGRIRGLAEDVEPLVRVPSGLVRRELVEEHPASPCRCIRVAHEEEPCGARTGDHEHAQPLQQAEHSSPHGPLPRTQTHRATLAPTGASSQSTHGRVVWQSRSSSHAPLCRNCNARRPTCAGCSGRSGSRRSAWRR